MSARLIARELAVIVLPQLPKDKIKLEKTELDSLVVKSVQMLSDYAEQCLAEAKGFLVRMQENLAEIELEHPINEDAVEDLTAAPLTTLELREGMVLLEKAMHLIAEALDIPEMVVRAGRSHVLFTCKECSGKAEQLISYLEQSETSQFLFRLVSTFFEHRKEIDGFIGRAKAKWKIERMVSIDRDILRLACTEALYFHDVPVNVCISEAIKLSHHFADERAVRFINGVLADLASEARRFRLTGMFTPAVDNNKEHENSTISTSSGSRPDHKKIERKRKDGKPR